MLNFKIISNANEIAINSKWVPASKFNSKNRVVDEKGHQVGSNYKGRQYRIIEKRERTFSGLERFGRGLLGTVAVICTLCLGLFSKSVRNLFTKSKANIRYAIPSLDDNSQIQSSHSKNNSNISAIKKENFPKEGIAFTSSQEASSKEDFSFKGNIQDKAIPIIKSSQIHLNSKQKKIMEEFTPQMVEALGGVDKVLSFPILKHWNGRISQEQLTAPVMIGYHKDGSPFLLFCYLKQTEYGYKVSGEYLGRKKNSWEGAYAEPSELNLRSSNPILDGSPGEKYMLGKISRLTKGEVVGVVEKFPGVFLIKPSDKVSFSPDNAYLEQEELHAYMDVDTIFYEKMPKEGTAGLYSYDPRISKEENINSLKKKFPRMERLSL